MLVLLFWGLIAFCLYAYIGYPIFLILCSVLRRQSHEFDASFTPSLSIVVVAHNEADVIQAKLDNLLSQNYPDGLLEIIVASDGSNDGMNAIIARHSRRDPKVKLLALPRQGKAYALNAAVASATKEILVFSDANAMLDPGALRHLTCHFADAQIGGVAGNLCYICDGKTDSAGLGETLYWRYDQWLKQMETRVGSAISADGSLYAIRRALYVPLVNPTVADDFAISSRVIVQGYRLIYEPKAIVREDTAGSSGREFRRKVRIVNRGLCNLFSLKSFLWPWRGGFYAFQLISHKLLRCLVPFVLPLLLAINGMLWPTSPFFRLTLIAQGTIYGLGTVGLLLRDTSWSRIWPIYIPYYFCQANLAALLGWVHLLCGRRVAIWQPQRGET